MKLSRLSLAFLAALSLTALGCGSQTRHKIVALEGKIAFVDGTPLPAGTQVVLNPTDGGVGTASGVTDANGSFVVEHVTGQAGAEEGKYQVALLAPKGNPGNFWELVPRAYADGQMLSAEVKDGTPSLDLKVTRAKGKGK